MIRQFGKYEATVCIRRGNGRRVRPEAEKLDGKRYAFRAEYMLTEDERADYAGEWVMTSHHPAIEVGWVASGELKDIRELGWETALCVPHARVAHRIPRMRPKVQWNQVHRSMV